MLSLNKEQIDILFKLAEIEVPAEILSDDINNALVKIEQRINPYGIIMSELELSDIPTILIIDDLDLSIYQLSTLLSRCGYHIHIASNYEEAIDKYKKHRFQYVLLDLFLPNEEDGIKLLENINGFEKTSEYSTKVIIISGSDDNNMINECFKKGASEFIAKNKDWHNSVVKYIRKLETVRLGSSSGLNIFVDSENDKIVILRPTNLYRQNVIEDIEKEFASLANSNYKHLIMDFEDINRIEPRGITALITGYRIFKEKGGSFSLCNVRSQVSQSLSYIHLDNVITIFKDKVTAIKAVQRD